MARDRNPREDVVRTSRQLGWLGVAMIVAGLAIYVLGGSGAFPGVFALLGFGLLVGTRYLVGRYED